MKPMTLLDTIEPMKSTDYLERLIAEYNQITIRYNGLSAMLRQWKDGSLPFEPKSDHETYLAQQTAMHTYRAMLCKRLMDEGVDVTNDERLTQII